MSDLMNNQEQFPFHFLQMKNFVQILDLISRNLKGIFILFFIFFLRCPRYFSSGTISNVIQCKLSVEFLAFLLVLWLYLVGS